MADWLNNLGTGLGNALIGVNNPFGLAPPEGFDRNAAMRQGALSLGMNVLANASENPAVALGRGYRQAQAIASDNQQNAMAAEAMMAAAEEKRRKRQEEEQAKQEREAFLKTLPPDVQMKARSIPGYLDSYIEATDPVFQEANASGGGADLGMTPIPLSDGQGGWAVGQLSPSGGVMINGKPAGPQWKYDPYGLAYDKTKGGKEGGMAGEAGGNYESMKAKLPGLETVIVRLDELAKKATYTLGGQIYNAGRTQLGMAPTEGQVARTEYQAVVANQILPLLRDTFGAQFTAREGDTLMATLGDPDKTPQEKQAVLKAFIEQKKRDIEALGVQSGKLLPPGADDPLAAARAAIQQGADPEAVKQRLRDNGIDPAGL